MSIQETRGLSEKHIKCENRTAKKTRRLKLAHGRDSSTDASSFGIQETMHAPDDFIDTDPTFPWSSCL